MRFLYWDSGTRAAAEGKDIASVAARLTDDDLAFWVDNASSASAAERTAVNCERLLGVKSRLTIVAVKDMGHSGTNTAGCPLCAKK